MALAAFCGLISAGPLFLFHSSCLAQGDVGFLEVSLNEDTPNRCYSIQFDSTHTNQRANLYPLSESWESVTP